MAGTVCRAALSALPLPFGDRRSSILGDPTARTFPETPPDRPEMASEPMAGGEG